MTLPTIFETYKPQYPLNQFVDHFIYYDGYNPTHSIDRFLPDGNTEIIIDFDDRPQPIYDNETLKEIQTCQKVWASGVRTQFISIPSRRHAAMFIISFKKGMAYPVFPFPMNEVSDRVVDADLLWGKSFLLLREHLLATRNIGLKFKAVETFLVKHFQARMVQNPVVEYALAEILRKPSRISMARISENIGYSQKHFIALFKRQVGVTPTAYMKIIRFQKAINDIETRKDVNWLTVSEDCGFYDQSHFINDFRNFAGFSPEEYLRRKNHILNYVPIG